MKRRRILTAVILPLLLAAAVLALGILLPDWLLRRQENQLLGQASTVPVDAVRPYGDGYDEMKRELLTSSRVMFGSGMLNFEESTEEEMQNTLDAGRAFLDTWRENAKKYGITMDSLLNEGETYLEKVAGEDENVWALNIYTLGDGQLDGIYAATLTPSGIPFYASGNAMIGGEENSEQIWQALRDTYQSEYGLNFNVTLQTVYDRENGVSDQSNLSESGYEGFDRTYTAVSSDLSLYLEMQWEIFRDDPKSPWQCWFSYVLTENTGNDFG